MTPMSKDITFFWDNEAVPIANYLPNFRKGLQLPYSAEYTMKMEVANYSETSITNYKQTRRHIQETLYL